MGMLPQTPFVANSPVIHESINDLPVHRATTRQVFHPVSESRQFTRRDAGKVFDRQLLPAEDRIPHPELYRLAKWSHEGVLPGERIARQRELNEKEEEAKRLKEIYRKEKEDLTTKKTETPRWEFRFKDISVDSVGRDGRDRRGVGARYGIPPQDRKKGMIKIPTRVE